MKVLVISGFLGAGKTTFLKELAARTHRDFVVMENEYGQVPIDGAVLQHSQQKLNIWELTEGCICCSSKSDFASSVLTIANTLDPEYLIVEPTGVGMLSQVLKNLQNILYDRIQLLSPVTLADGKTFDRYEKEYREIFKDQLQNAGTILITKMESGSEEELSQLEDKIHTLAPDRKILKGHYRQQEDSWYLSLLNSSLSGEILGSSDQAADFENLGLSQIRLQSPDQLLLILNGIVSGVFGKICRSKGYLQAGESWLRFDTSAGSYSLTGCEPMEESRAVFIGSELQRSRLREVLQQEITVSTGFQKTPSPRMRRSR